jgi:hypothetical protein
VLGFVQKIAELTQPTGSISILLNTYAHFIPTMQDQAAQPARKNRSLGFAAKYAAQLMDEILTPVPGEFHPVST